MRTFPVRRGVPARAVLPLAVIGALVAAAAPVRAAPDDARLAGAVVGVDVGRDGVCSLAEAILRANGTDVSAGECDRLVSTDEGVEILLSGRYHLRGRYPAVKSWNRSPQPGGERLYLPIAVGANGTGFTALPSVTGKAVIIGGVIEQIAAYQELFVDGAIRGVAHESFLRLLEVAPGGSLTLRGVTLRGGAPGGWFARQPGGAVLVRPGGTLVLEDCVLSGNAADGGGAIAVDGGWLTMDRSWLVDNRARTGDGGAVLVTGDQGEWGSVRAEGAGFAANTASGSGGALAIEDHATAKLIQVTIAGNKAAGSASDEGGGGIFVRDGYFDLEGGQIVENHGEWGGAVAVARNGEAGFYDTLIARNSAFWGGGLHVAYGATGATIDHGVLEGNCAGEGGGGLFGEGGRLVLDDVDVAGNCAASGAGLYLSLADTTISESAIRDNWASDCGGGGIYQDSDAKHGSLRIVNTTISGNHGACRGGGIFHAGGVLTIAASTIAANEVPPGDATGPDEAHIGSGMFVDPSGEGVVTVSGTIIAANRGVADCGGAPASSGGYNLDGGTSCGLRGNGDVRGVDAGMSALGEYGGPTMTHVLLPGSAALDRIPRGSAGCGIDLRWDQRGMVRPNPTQGRCDIGAYER
jgi:hypothetical protein